MVIFHLLCYKKVFLSSHRSDKNQPVDELLAKRAKRSKYVYEIEKIQTDDFHFCQFMIHDLCTFYAYCLQLDCEPLCFISLVEQYLMAEISQ